MKIEEFIRSLRADTYEEPPSALHDAVTMRAINSVLPQLGDKQGMRVLDIGCGQGVAVKELAKRGLITLGTGVNQTDLEACKAQGLDVIEADMHDWDHPRLDGPWDLVWCRHVLEHSPIPLYVLRMIRERLAVTGLLYVEVPMPGTSCKHETNPNHYSVLTEDAWYHLIGKAGFSVIETKRYSFKTVVGPDTYVGFVVRK